MISLIAWSYKHGALDHSATANRSIKGSNPTGNSSFFHVFDFSSQMQRLLKMRVGKSTAVMALVRGVDP